MQFRHKIVLCSNCGFLGWITDWPEGEPTLDRQRECNPRTRSIFQKGEFSGEEQDYEGVGTHYLCCYRWQWMLTLYRDDKDRNLFSPDTIRRPQQCKYYIEYQPGFKVEEHKELQREAKTRRTIIFATLLGALVGAFAAIIAGRIFSP